MAELNETFLVNLLRPTNISDTVDGPLETVQKPLKDIQPIVQENSTEHQQHQQNSLDLVGVLPKSDEEIVFPNVIDLNVGGYHYTTSLSTLRKYEDSMLAVMFSGRYQLVRNEEGHIFIDRDGKYFGHILNYIRGDTIPPESLSLDVLREAEFFCISSLMTKLETSSPCVISLRRREYFRRLIPDYEHMKMDIINRCVEKRSSFHESKVVISQLDHTKLKGSKYFYFILFVYLFFYLKIGTIPCYNCSREFVTVNHACAFDGLTADLQIQQQLKPIQNDIHIDMDKLIAFVVDELCHDGFKATCERVICRFSVRCQGCTLSGLYTAGGILAPRECQNVAHVVKFIWS
ncbi:unnamed protein product [Didymodactylos carnosus]|uniref:BTB domain-containing protein n=1 Tax=Didymodactylos carnosus TaxID=1234261 RepID=A0A813YAM5_9BILA|nr:unnamed protein product [Didymodactylos carnosus]CAF0881454.1 unnamed protein product [Didymodactylos carnosus]CAF3610813.1 unnamed protein product [Didymodactylos carnosus]CAF3667578.1 unnamed protein product [Didymodactylos carnosus]